MHTTEQRKKWGLKGAISKWSKAPPYAERFWRRVVKKGPDECWDWIGYKQHGGYGSYKLNGKPRNASRIAFMLSNPDVNMDGLLVCHRCDNPPCCNPDHLFLGTHKDNTQDMCKKGRKADKRGEKHHFAKLTNEDVILIRELHHSGKRPFEIRNMLGFSRGMVESCINRHTWNHIP